MANTSITTTDKRQLLSRRNRRKMATAAIAICLLSSAIHPHSVKAAGFVDDWVSQTSSTDAGYFKGSERGYFTGGSFSARWPQSNDNLLTISKPSLKSGCGGIDMFLGGFSFLDVDKLVQKLQRILAAAPAAAFDIALKTLAPQVADTIKSLEALIEKLNNLQIDDCKAAKALVSAPISAFGIGGNALQGEATAAITDFKVSSGIDQDWKGSIDKLQSSVTSMFSGGGAAPEVQSGTSAATDGCPAPLKNLFAEGSLLKNIASTKGFSDDQVDLIRGFIGDVYIYSPGTSGGTIDAEYDPPCGQNTFQSLIDGKAQKRTLDSGCVAMSDTNKDLRQFAFDRMVSIANSMKNKTAMTAQDLEFAQTVSSAIPIWPAIRAGVRVQNEAAIIGQLADIASKVYAYQMFLDIQMRVSSIHTWIDHVKTTQKNPDVGKDPKSCQLSLFAPITTNLETLEKKSTENAREAYDQVVAAAGQSTALNNIVTSLREFDQISRKEIAANFSRSVANRALR